MSGSPDSGNAFRCLDGVPTSSRRRVPTEIPLNMHPAEFHSEPRWQTWGRPALAVAVVVVLVALGVANVVMRAQWHEVEDGVLWGARSEGVTALDIAAGSPAAHAGIEQGDLLIAVN